VVTPVADPKLDYPDQGIEGWRRQMSPWMALSCRAGQRFPHPIPELRLAGIKHSNVSWSFPKCKIASREKKKKWSFRLS